VYLFSFYIFIYYPTYIYPHNSRIPPTRETIVPIKSPIWQLRHVKDRVKRDVPAARDNRKSNEHSMTHKRARYDFAVARKVARPLYSRDTREHHAGLSMRIDRDGISQTRRNLPLWWLDVLRLTNAWSFALLRYDYAVANVTAARMKRERATYK